MAFLDSIAQEVNLMNIDKHPSTHETGETPRSFCCSTGEKGMSHEQLQNELNHTITPMTDRSNG